MIFFQTLYQRNESLWIFGCFCFAMAIGCLVMSIFSQTRVQGVPAWHKPLKFCLSIGVYSWTMGWFSGYLPANFPHFSGNSLIISCLAFEIVYIGFQAGRGELSHFNHSSRVFSVLYNLMALAATAVALWTAYVGYVFCSHSFPDLPGFYIWSIRLGILLFVLFSLQGFAMGARLSHLVGGAEEGLGIPFLGWSLAAGDLRIAHFLGMHALQVVPLLAWFVLRNTGGVFLFSGIWLLVAVWTFHLALRGKPLFQFET